jgi:glycosyltransferase involved in cell wall biosynthesis
MKILYLSWFNSGEGSQIHAREFMNAMQELNHEVIPVELSLKTKKQLQNLNVKGNNSSHKKSKFAFLKELKTFLLNIVRIFRLLWLYKKHRPDAIINRYLIYDCSAIIAGKLLNVPVMYEVNASAVYEREIENRYYIKLLAKTIEKFVFKHADVVTVVSNELLNYFKENQYDTSKTIVIPNGVDIKRYPHHIPVPASFEEIAKKWKDKTIIGFLGSLKSWHGVERVIDLMPQLLKENPDIRFLIIGDGNEREAIETKIDKLGLRDYVYISGFIPHDDVPGAISLFDIALAPYKNIDNFYFSPLKIFEYMAAGKPVIAPALGQIKELIEQDVSGILLFNNSDEELKSAIIQLSLHKEKIEKLGKNARKFIEQHYTWKVNAEKIAAALEREIKGI